MEFKVLIECNNAAFGKIDSADFNCEVSSILQNISKSVYAGVYHKDLFDSNGNCVGYAELCISPREEAEMEDEDER